MSTEYGLLAEAVSYPTDYSSVTYRLRANARWHDGKPVTADDVIFSFDAFKKNSPLLRAPITGTSTKAEKTGEREITFTFDGPGNRELPQIVGQLPVLPKHWWEGTDKSGSKRDVTQTTLEPPLGSGALSDQGIRARPHHRSTKKSTIIGARTSMSTSARDNFDELRYEYFRDSTVALEAFKGDQIDWRTENSAKNWATAYDFPGGARQARDPGGIPDPQFGRHAGLRLQYPARQVQGSARAPRLQLRVRFRGDEQAALLRPIQAHQQLFRRHRACRVRRAAGQGAGNL